MLADFNLVESFRNDGLILYLSRILCGSVGRKWKNERFFPLGRLCFTSRTISMMRRKKSQRKSENRNNRSHLLSYGIVKTGFKCRRNVNKTVLKGS